MNIARVKTMKKLYLALSILIITVVFAFAGWESYIQLTSPADGDIITVQDVSVTGVGDGSGKISYLTLSGLWSYISTKITASDVAVTDADENFAGTNAEAVLDELYNTKEPSQTPAGQAEMEAGTETAIRSMSPLRVAQAIAAQVDTSARTVTAHGSVSGGTEDFSPGIHTVTVSGVFAWAFTSWPASGTEGVIRAYITNGGSASFTGWGDVVWEGGVAPTLQASGLDVVTFTSLDGGTTVYGFLAGEDMQ